MLKVQLINITHRNYIPIALHTIKCYAETQPFVKANSSIQIVEPSDISDHDSIIAKISSDRPHVLGCSMYVWSAQATLIFLKKIRKLFPEIKIVVGGPDVTPVAESFMSENNDFIDFVVMGEGELTFSELLEYFIDPKAKNIHDIKGLCFFENDKVIITQKRPVIENLDIIPSPYLTGSVDLKNEKRVILLETYRGCPYACSFCYYPKDYGSNIHSYGNTRLEEEIKFIFAHGITDLMLMDPTFNVPPKRAVDILKIVAKYKTNSLVRINTELRIDHLNDEVIEWFQKAGFRSVELGLQSANPKVLQAVARSQDLKKTTDNIKKLRERDILLITQLIVGLPLDNFESIKNSIQYAIDIGSEKIEMYQLQLLPGTPMFRDANKLGLVYNEKPPRWIKYTPTMSEEQIRQTMRFTKMVYLIHCLKAARTTFNVISNLVSMRMIDLVDDYFNWLEEQQTEYNLLDVTNAWIKSTLSYKRESFDDSTALKPILLLEYFEYLETKYGLNLKFIGIELLRLDFQLSANYIKVLHHVREIKDESLRISKNFFRTDELRIDPRAALSGQVKLYDGPRKFLFFPDYHNTFKSVLNGTLTSVAFEGPYDDEQINSIISSDERREDLTSQKYALMPLQTAAAL